MKKPTRYLISLGMLTTLLSCKASSEGGSSDASLSADSAAVSRGEEALISQNSTPAPKFPAGKDPKDYDPAYSELGDVTVAREDVAKIQIPGSDLTGTPRELQGIWWFDGNPDPDETVSFANVDFTQDRPLLPTFAANNFTWHAGDGTDPAQELRDRAGVQFFYNNLAVNQAGIYEFQFTGKGAHKYDEAKIVLTFVLKIGLIERRLRTSPLILDFSMKKIGENEYTRISYSAGKRLPDYQLKRILVPSAADPKILEKTEHWDAYAKADWPKRLRGVVRKK